MTFIFFGSVYNKTIIRFFFCDIQNNQSIRKGYQYWPLALAYNPYLNLTKTHPIIVNYLGIVIAVGLPFPYKQKLYWQPIYCEALGARSSSSSSCPTSITTLANDSQNETNEPN